LPVIPEKASHRLFNPALLEAVLIPGYCLAPSALRFPLTGSLLEKNQGGIPEMLINSGASRDGLKKMRLLIRSNQVLLNQTETVPKDAKIFLDQLTRISPKRVSK
jgi:hypothetical protein